MGCLGLIFPLIAAAICIILKDVGLNTALSGVYMIGIVFVTACLVIERFSDAAFVIAASCILIAAIALATILFSNDTLYNDKNGDTSSPPWKSKSYLFKYLFLSIPVIGLFDFFFTDGLVRRVDGSPLSNMLSVLAIGICCIAISVFAAKRRHAHGSRLSFELFELALPAIAAFALIIKLVPIDWISDYAFANYMYFVFQFFTLVTFLSIAHLSYGSVEKSLFFSGMLPLVIATASAGGYFLGGLTYPINDFALGIVTAVTLVYVALSLGRNAILFSSGFRLIEEKPGVPLANPVQASKSDPEQQSNLDIEERCKVLAEKYNLTARETDVLIELAHGYSPAYIAKAFYLSVNTIKSHNKNLYRKLNIGSRYELFGLLFASDSDEMSPLHKCTAARNESLEE